MQRRLCRRRGAILGPSAAFARQARKRHPEDQADPEQLAAEAARHERTGGGTTDQNGARPGRPR